MIYLKQIETNSDLHNELVLVNKCFFIDAFITSSLEY